MNPGQRLGVTIERPAAGGRMLARVEGRVLLVDGGIPGERVTVEIERVGKGVVFARTLSVDEPSPDRREPAGDPHCGGCVYAAIAYPRQLAFKAAIVEDAFARLARLELPEPVAVAPSPEQGYRMRARLHARGGRIGFFREGTHDVCDVSSTGQLLADSCAVLDTWSAALRSHGQIGTFDVELAENVPADARVIHLDTDRTRLQAGTLRSLVPPSGVTGFLAGDLLVVGDAHVSDRLTVGGREVTLRRDVRSFFQGNRYLLEPLCALVVDLVGRPGAVVDFYAGVGLFAVPVAAGGAQVTAVEGDRWSAADLTENARASGTGLRVERGAVEGFRTTERVDVAIVDPPRTGMSREALDSVLRLRAGTIVYVSCDPATLARDARRIVDAGWRMDRVAALDLFPNTPHVETVIRFRA